jgi:hypothetical protein
MKLRISANTIRLRLTRPEAQRLAGGEALQERLDLPPAPLSYSLETKPGSGITALLDAGVLRIVAPLDSVRRWSSSDEVGIECDVPGTGSKPIRLLIEKDFRCAHDPAEVQADCFPNPRGEDDKVTS